MEKSLCLNVASFSNRRVQNVYDTLSVHELYNVCCKEAAGSLIFDADI